MNIQVTTVSGELLVIPEATAIVYVKLCRYCGHEFKTANPRRIFCIDSHKVKYCQKKIARAAH